MSISAKGKRSHARTGSGPVARPTRVLAWLLLLLLAAGAAGSAWLPYPRGGGADGNPFPWRGWPEYLSGPDLVDTVVIIGNSQAVGRELTSNAERYPNRLDVSLRAHGLRVENWSLECIRMAEIELLVAKAMTRRARLVIVSIMPLNLERPEHVRLGDSSSDIHLLAGEPALWSHLGQSVLARNLDADQLLSRFGRRYWAWLRAGERLRDRAASLLHHRHHELAFGSRRSRIAALSADELPPPSGRPPVERQARRSAASWQRHLDALTRPAFEAWTSGLAARLRDSDSRLLLVWMPVPHQHPRNTFARGAAEFFAGSCAAATARGIGCADLSRSIDDARFLRAFNWTHLDAAGHQILAERLHPLIRDAVH